MQTKWNGNLPQMLLLSAEYTALNTAQKSNFLGRLLYLDEIAEKLFETAKTQNSDLHELIDDIELDSLSVISLGDKKTQVSPYLMHSSWVFECQTDQFESYVSADTWKFLSVSPIFSSMQSKIETTWFVSCGELLRNALSKFSNASTFTAVIAHLIEMDMLISALLLFCSSYRLRVKVVK